MGRDVGEIGMKTVQFADSEFEALCVFLSNFYDMTCQDELLQGMSEEMINDLDTAVDTIHIANGGRSYHIPEPVPHLFVTPDDGTREFCDVCYRDWQDPIHKRLTSEVD